MKIKKIIIVIVTFFLTSCYDNKELNDIAILTATEINKIDNNYIINALVVNPQAPDKTINAEAPFIIYTGSGKTIQQAYRNIKLSSSRYIYPEHLEILIINEQIARENIDEILDFYLRNPSIRTEFNILIGKNHDILSATTPIDQISSLSILKSLKTNTNFLGITNLTTLNDLTTMALNPHIEIVLPSIELDNHKEEANNTTNTNNTKIDSIYKLSNLTIFKDNRLIDYLTESESFTYNLIKNNLGSSIITYQCDKDKYLSTEIITSKTKIITKNQQIKINIKTKLTINESNCNYDLNNINSINNLENNLANYLKQKITTDINNVRYKYNSDIFGFLDEIYKHDYKTYIKVKDDWYNGIYQNIPIIIDNKITIVSKGNIMRGGINEKD